MPPVDTASTKDRRAIRFNTIDDLLQDLNVIEDAHNAQTLRVSGNWSPGEMFTHIAAFINYPYDGYPAEIAEPPFLITVIFRFMKQRFLQKPMRPGIRIPGTRKGTVGAREVSFDEGFTELLESIARLVDSPPPLSSPIFGYLTHEEWKLAHLRHAELHLSFLHPTR